MNIHIRRRLFVLAAVLGALAVLVAAFLVAQGVRSVGAGPDSAPAASPPNPGHSWSEIGDLPGTMWHSNNDGAGSGLDADTVDGQQANQIQDADDYVSNAGYATTAGDADRLDGQHGAYYQNASNVNAGTLGTPYYSAHSDLSAEGYLGNAAGDLAQNNGTVQTNLNADLLDGLQASELGAPGPAAIRVLRRDSNWALKVIFNHDMTFYSDQYPYVGILQVGPFTLGSQFFFLCADGGEGFWFRLRRLSDDAILYSQSPGVGGCSIYYQFLHWDTAADAGIQVYLEVEDTTTSSAAVAWKPPIVIED